MGLDTLCLIIMSSYGYAAAHCIKKIILSAIRAPAPSCVELRHKKTPSDLCKTCGVLHRFGGVFGGAALFVCLRNTVFVMTSATPATIGACYVLAPIVDCSQAPFPPLLLSLPAPQKRGFVEFRGGKTEFYSPNTALIASLILFT